MIDWTLWRSQAKASLRAGDMGALATLRSLAPHKKKKSENGTVG
jgi:hypothetical protein